jgi:cyclase
MKRLLICVFVGLSLLGLLFPAFAQQQVPPLSVQNMRGNIYQVKGGAGANTGFFIGEKEVFVIDAKMTEDSARQMIAEIRKLTPKPIRYIIITHSDRDHVNGLVGFPRELQIISHENTGTHMDKAFQSPGERVYLPDITFSERLTLFSPAGTPKAKRIDLLYFGPGHTDGDAVVYFPDEKVAFIGDLIFIGRDQLIHRHKNGTSFGLVKVLKNVLSIDAQVFVNGHGDPVTKKEIENHIRSIEEKQARIVALMKEGKTLEQVKKIYNIDDKPGATPWPSLVEVIYLELKGKN